MTYLELVNEVLVRLRERTVSTVNSDARGRVIGALVNLAKDSVEAAWNWSALRTDLTMTTTAGNGDDWLTGSTQATRLIKTEHAEEGYNVTSACPLRRIPLGSIDRLRLLQPTYTGSPVHFGIAGYSTTTGYLGIRLSPIPDATYTLTFPAIVPQAQLSSDTDVLKVPFRPVVELAYALAMMERGEDAGTAVDDQKKIANAVLNDAIGNDTEKFTDENIWVPY